MFLFGTGYKDLVLFKSTRGKEFLHSLKMKLLFRLAIKTTIYG
jgi:hypothetical protein